MFAIFSFLIIALCFYLVGSLFLSSQNRANPLVYGVPVIYLFFLFSLNVRYSLLFLLAAALASLIMVHKKIDFKNLLKFSLIGLVLFLVICQHQLLGWDTRSIWFFHSKMIYFLNGSELMRGFGRDEIAIFSHSDYPKLQPFLGAMFAAPFDVWKEQVAKSSLALLWIPVFSEVFQIKNIKIKSLALFFILVMSTGQIIAGMTDWLLACHVLIAFLIYNENSDRWLDSIAYLSLPILIKAEGLVITVLGVSMILALKSGFSHKLILKNSYRAALLLLIPGLAFVVWKIQCSHYSIHNYLTIDPAATVAKLTGRLTDHGKSFWIFMDGFGYYNKVIKNMMYIALVRRVMIWKKITNLEVAVFSFVALYATFLFFTYMATPFDLDWHLSTSVQRTAFPIFLLALVTLLIRDIDPAKKF